MKKAIPAILLLGFTGCISISLIGGRHQNITMSNSNKNDVAPDMEAPSDVDVRDVLKELYPPNVTPPVVLPPGTPPPVVNPPPVDPPPVEPPPMLPGDDIWLNKPNGENDRLLKWLTPSNKEATRVELYAGTSAHGTPVAVASRNDPPQSNTKRWTFTYPKPGQQYPDPATHLTYFADNSTKAITVHPGQRQEFDINGRYIER